LFFHIIQTGYGTHPASYTKGKQRFFPRGLYSSGLKLTTLFISWRGKKRQRNTSTSIYTLMA
jgi:hypothetical protein